MSDYFKQLLKRNRLRIKLLVSVIGVVLLFLSISTYFSVKQTGEIILEQLDVYGVSLSRSLANFTVEDLISWDYPKIQAAILHIGQYDTQIVEIGVYHDGKEIASYNSDSYPGGVAQSPEELTPSKIPHCDCLEFKTPVNYYIEALGENKVLGEVRVVLSKSKYDLFLAQQIRLLLYLSLILLIGDSVLSYLTVKLLVLDPIKKVQIGSEIIGSGDLDHRINIDRDDEISALAESFNNMAKNLKLSQGEAENYKKHLEEKVRVRTAELNDLTKNLELKVAARTRQIEEERNKTRATLVSLSAGLVVLDQAERITLVNPAAEDILHLNEEEVVGKKIGKIVKIPLLKKLFDLLGGKIIADEKSYELVAEGQLIKYYQVTVTPITAENKAVGNMIILHDITRDKEIERMKDEFISISAHQLRTPSSAIKWTLNMILGGEMGRINKEVKEYIKRASETNDRMIALVDDLLNISRIEEGRFIYEKSLVSFPDFINEIVATFSITSMKKGIKVKMETPKKAISKVSVDTEKMTIAFQNLIDNAIRYSEKNSEVVIKLSEVIQKSKSFIQAEIKDKGIGIPKKDLERLYSKFYRGENAVRKQTEGSGLGLFITRNIIAAHGGELWVESEIDKGTTFFVKIPVVKKSKKLT